jgi:predicted nucleotide-binding protein
MSGNVHNYGDIVNQPGGSFTQGGTHVTNNHDADRRPRRNRAQAPRERDEASLADPSRNVFVVYGRDEQARLAVFELLRRLDLRPLEWEALVRATGAGSPFLGQVVGDAPALAQAAVVVLTPDDVVMLHQKLRVAREDRHELRPALQPRPNVLIELGMVLAVYPEKTIILEFGDLRPIADLAGRNVIRFSEAVPLTGALRKVAGRLEEAGCPIDDSGSDWLDNTPFTDLSAYRRCPP